MIEKCMLGSGFREGSFPGAEVKEKKEEEVNPEIAEAASKVQEAAKEVEKVFAGLDVNNMSESDRQNLFDNISNVSVALSALGIGFALSGTAFTLMSMLEGPVGSGQVEDLVLAVVMVASTLVTTAGLAGVRYARSLEKAEKGLN